MGKGPISNIVTVFSLSYKNHQPHMICNFGFDGHRSVQYYLQFKVHSNDCNELINGLLYLKIFSALDRPFLHILSLIILTAVYWMVLDNLVITYIHTCLEEYIMLINCVIAMILSLPT